MGLAVVPRELPPFASRLRLLAAVANARGLRVADGILPKPKVGIWVLQPSTKVF